MASLGVDATGDARARAFSLLGANPAALEDFVRHTSVGLAVLDEDLRVLYLNEVQARVTGHSANEVIGRPAREITDSAAWDTLETHFRDALAGVASGDVVIDQAPKGPYGSPRRWRLSFSRLYEAGRVVAAAATLVDVSPSEVAERGVALRSRLLDLLTPGTRDSPTTFFERVCELAILGGQFRAAWVGAVGVSGLEIVGAAGIDRDRLAPVVAGLRLDPDDPLSRGPAIQALATGRARVHNAFATDPDVAPWHDWARENRVGSVASFPIHADRSVRAVLTLYAPEPHAFSDETVAVLGDVTLILSGAYQGIIDDQRRRLAQRELEQRDQIIAAISEGVAVFDARDDAYPALYVSPGFESLTGYRDGAFLGRNLRALLGPASDPAVVAAQRAAVEAGHAFAGELLHYRPDGSTFWDRVSLTPYRDDAGQLTHYVAVLADVTEQRTLERRAAQSEKMEAVTTLAAGVAHDFNNALLVVRGYASLLATGADPTAVEMARRIDAAVEHAATISRRLFALGPTPTGRLESLDLTRLVGELVATWSGDLDESVAVSLALAPRLPAALVDRAQVTQAVTCLLENAREALGHSGGLISVTTEALDSDPTVTERLGATDARHFLRVTVTDNGPGMDEATRARALEPFFSTKDHAAGLGLAVVYGVASQCGGSVEIQSAPGEGTRVDLYLPVDTEAKVARTAPTRPSRSVRVLLVEDLAEARALVARALSNAGFEVAEAGDGAEALEVARALGTVDLVVSDVSMPRVNGLELAARLSRDQPATRFLFTSGYPSEEIVREVSIGAPTAFLAKPYLIDELVRRATELLEAD